MLTPLAKILFRNRLAAARLWRDGGAVEDVQRKELSRLIECARSTQWGVEKGFHKVKSYEDYRQALDHVTAYEELRPYVMRMIEGEKSVLWPGRITSFAQSSGTSDGRSKFIPITPEGLSRCHYRGTSHTVAHYLDNVPDSHLFDGKAFILGGSFASTITPPKGVSIGDLSATLISRMPRLASYLRVPDRNTALLADWSEKLPKLIDAAASRNDITNISGVPSWFLTVIKGILEKTGAKNLHEVWPHLEVFFHGGIAFGPYREQYRKITDPAKMHFLENYNASEGFFAAQDDLTDSAMLLILDAATFYEFRHPGEPDDKLVPAWQTVKGDVYEMVITNANGLWRYPIGDTVKIESTAPLKITIAGRTKHFINAFGEEVMVYNADAAIAAACRETDSHVANYTAAPVYADDRTRGRHQWLVEFNHPPTSIEAFAESLDRHLQMENSDYQAKRTGSIFLDPPEVVTVPQGIFDRWLGGTGRLGGQRKVPRLSNNREYADSILELLSKMR